MSSSEPQDSGGWSFLQALTNTTNNNSQANDDNSNTTNEIFLRLSENSLQMCTEILGDETGSIVFESEEICTENNTPKRQKDSSKKNDQCKSFPPPLSSSGVLRIRPHRESGRLILQGPVHDDNEEEEEEETGSVVLENEEIRTDNNSPKKQQDSSSSKNNDEEEYRSIVFPPPLSSTGVLHTRPHHGEGGGPILQPVPAHDEQKTEEELDEQVLEKREQEQEQEQLQEDEEK